MNHYENSCFFREKTPRVYVYMCIYILCIHHWPQKPWKKKVKKFWPPKNQVIFHKKQLLKCSVLEAHGIYIYMHIYLLVGGFNPSETSKPNWAISPNRVKIKNI